MGRRTSKAGNGVAATSDVDTVGMTILPGHPLPEWADPDQAPAAATGTVAPGADAWAEPNPQQVAQVANPPQVPEQVAAAMAAAGVSGAWAASGGPSAAAPAAAQDHQSPFAPPVPAMAAAGVMAGTAAMSTAAMTPAPGHVAPPAPTGSFPAAATATPPPATTGSSPTPVGAAGSHGPAMGAGAYPSGTSGVGTAPVAPTTAGMPQAASPSSAPQASPMTHGQALGTETPGAAVGSDPMHRGAATATMTEPAPGGGPTPSQGWTAPDRPELSPEHVALLSWWADMIAKGQVPAPPAQTTPASPVAPAKRAPKEGTGPKGRLVALGLAGVVVVGLGVAFGPAVVGAVMGGDPEPVPATELTMPVAVGDLVAVTGPDASAQLEALVGFGLRPAGITVTAAYGTDPAGPVVLGAMATTLAPDADATGQLNAWAAQSGATLGEQVAGTGSTAGITCAASEGTDSVPAGSMCVWSGTGMSGRTYVVSTDPAGALERTAELRAAMPAATS